jgi:hypothetical protein
MTLRLWRFVSIPVLLVTPVLLWSQVPSSPPDVSPASPGNTPASALLPEPAVPADPLELVTGNAESVQTADQRSAVANLLAKALALSNVRSYPYDKKSTFNSFGSTSSDGNWELHDTAVAGGLYRWTAQGPNYSVINQYKGKLLYSNQPAGSMPMRLTQTRGAMFFVRAVVGPRATLRTAAASLNGANLECVLLSHNGIAKGVTGGRRWEEAEYCVDTALGVLVTYSPVPGLYTVYDYSQAIRFHDLLIPNQFTISQSGRTIMQARTVSVTDPAPDFRPDMTGLNEVGFGSLMTAAWRINYTVPSATPGSGNSQVVVIHGMQAASGQVADLEVVASSDSSMNPQALGIVSSMHGRAVSDDEEPGATLQSHEVLITIQFTGTGF